MEINWGKDGLIPAVVQDAESREVLMVAYMNEEALKKTVETGYAHFFSRKRQRIWKKGEESGNTLKVKSIKIDCDGDTLLLEVEAKGPACHTGHKSCFYRDLDGKELVAPEKQDLYQCNCSILERVYEVILERRANPQRTDSYVASLFRKGLDKILKKVGEEASEVIIACKNQKDEEIVYEVADLFFHVLVALGYFDIAPVRIYEELCRRFGKSGLRK